MRTRAFLLLISGMMTITFLAPSQAIKVQEKPLKIKPLASKLFKPSVPGNFSADGYSLIETIVTWQHGSGAVTAFEIEEKIGSGVPSLRRIPATSSQATYMYAGPNVAACYRIRACSQNENSDWSDPACATSGVYKTPPPAPGNLKVAKVSATQINLSWQTETMLRWTEGFIIESKVVQTGAQYRKIATLKVKSINPSTGEIKLQSESSIEEYRSLNGITTYFDRFSSAIPAGVTYCYRVKAFNNAGSSAYTNEVCLTND